MCACRTVDAVRLLLSRGRAKEALVLFRLRLPHSLNTDLYHSCLSTLAERQRHSGLPASVICYLATGDVETAKDHLIAACPAHTACLIDRIAFLWSAFFLSPSSSSNNAFKLAHLIIQFADSVLDQENEQEKWLRRWSQALRGQSGVQWIFQCSRFLLLTNSRVEFDKPSDVDSVTKELEHVASDRQPSADPGVCLANLAVDFALRQLKSSVGASLGALRASLASIEDSRVKLITEKLKSLPDYQDL